MAYGVTTLDVTFKAGQDLADKKYHFVKFDANGQIVVCEQNEIAIGILQSETDTKGDTISAVGQAIRVRLLGTSKMIMSAACDPGALLTPTAEGIAAVSAVGDITTAGIALEKADSEDEIIDILITHIATFLV